MLLLFKKQKKVGEIYSYVTVLTDTDNKRVLVVVEGRQKRSALTLIRTILNKGQRNGVKNSLRGYVENIHKCRRGNV